MKIQVELFASVRDTAGKSVIELELSSTPQVAELRQRLAELWPDLKEVLERSRIAVNNQFSSDQEGLSESDAVAVIPPVSGG